MSDVVISVENLYKEYRLGTISHRALYRDLQSWWARIRGREDPNSIISPLGTQARSSENGRFLALRDVSFEVKQGEAVGIIGGNGAGKSTLLKILSRVTAPTKGCLKVRGRIASLLEVGTGFHPELTGRENIYLNGAILGMTKAEINRKFDEIVSFAEVEKFLDTPVKRYSSGMYVRLAFAVAAHLEPEILIVDEVLAVGDAQFQKKCLSKMEDIGKLGKTILFVSHNLGAVKTLCNVALLLSQGRLLTHDTSSKVVDLYMLSSIDKLSHSGEIHWPNVEEAPGGSELKLISVRLVGTESHAHSRFDAENPINIEITYNMLDNVIGMSFYLEIINSEGIVAFSSTDQNQRDELTTIGVHRTICTIPSYLLNKGRYIVKIFATVGVPGIRILAPGTEVLDFVIHSARQGGAISSVKLPGVVAPKLKWSTDKL